jgi:type IV secretion system protein VirB6
MFTWIGDQFDKILNGYLLDVVGDLAAALAPTALIAMTLWVLLYGWAVLRNEVTETVPVFLWKTFKIGLVLVFSLQSGIYIGNVADTANALAMGVATTFLPDGVDPAVLATPYALLDAFNDKASQLVLDLLKEAGIMRLDLVFATVVTAFGNVIFLCVALFVVTLAKVFMTFVLAVGFFALGVSVYMGDAILQVIENNGGFLGPNFNVVAESLKYCIVMILMAIICFQAPSLASALTGGAAVQQGVQMIQNAMMVSGLRAGNRGAAVGASGAGGVVRAGTGLPHAAGSAVGNAAAAATAAARRATGAARLSANKLAALRGRDKWN